MPTPPTLGFILLVDDDSFTNLFHRKIIERAGLDIPVQAVTSVQDALNWLTHACAADQPPLTASRPGLVFLDINMPGLTGWDFMQRYSQLDVRCRTDVSVIMLTTSQNPSDRERAQADRNIADFLHKPLTSSQVIALVNRLSASRLGQAVIVPE